MRIRTDGPMAMWQVLSLFLSSLNDPRNIRNAFCLYNCITFIFWTRRLIWRFFPAKAGIVFFAGLLCDPMAAFFIIPVQESAFATCRGIEGHFF